MHKKTNTLSYVKDKVLIYKVPDLAKSFYC